MENQNEEKCDDPEIVEENEEEKRRRRKNRSSILKVRKSISDDINIARSARRVSFSSNYIKPFMTDDDKNTIWDSTIEETINNTESTHSSENNHPSKQLVFNTSLFGDGLNCSDDLDVEIEKEIAQPVWPAMDAIPLAEKENIPIILKRDSLIVMKKTKVLSECGNGKVQERLNSTEREKISFEKNTVFVKPTISLPCQVMMGKKIKLTLPDNGDVDEMDLTCQSGGETSPDAVENMELTCKTIMLRTEPVVEDMEFTCKNPLLQSESVLDDMQVTCKTPLLQPESVMEDMEFTCKNISLQSEPVLEDMEFTCKNPLLQPEPVLEDLEFTCNNPLLQPEPVLEAMEVTCKNPTMQPEAVLKDMEFTCQNPLLQPKPALKDMEFTCGNPLLQTEPVLEDMEFTCKNPVLQPEPVLEDMEFTCKNLVLQPEPVLEDMEFTCKNPVLQPEPVLEDMGSTCKSPVLQPEPVLEDMEFTCKNPLLQPAQMTKTSVDIESTGQKPSPQPEDMEFSCRNLLLQPEIANLETTSENDVLQHETVDMETTYKNSVQHDPTLEDMELAVEKTLQQTEIKQDVELNCNNLELRSIDFETHEDVRVETGPRSITDSITALNKTNLADVSNMTMSKGISFLTTEFPQFDVKSVGTSVLDVDLPNLVLAENTVGEEGDVTNDNAQNVRDNSTLSMSNYTSQHVSSMSLCADDTKQLLRAASRINKTRNLTDGDSSLENSLRTQINATYVVKNKEIGLNEDVDTVEQNFDVFEKCRSFEANTIIDEESSMVLIENSHEDNSILNIEKGTAKEELILRSDTEVEEGSKLEGGILSDTSKVVGTNTAKQPCDENDEEWNAERFRAKQMASFLEFRQYCDSLKVPEPKPDNTLEIYYKKMKEQTSRSRERRALFNEKYAIFKKNLNEQLELLREKMNAPLEVEDEELRCDSYSEDIDAIAPTMLQQIEEKSKMSDCSWKLIKFEENVAEFVTLFDAMRLFLEYNTYHFVTSYSTKSRLNDKSTPLAFLLQKEFLKALTQDTINKSIGRNYTILSLLDYVQMVMGKIKKHYTYLKDLEISYDFTISPDFRASFQIMRIDLMVEWDFQIDLSDLDQITKDSVTVKAVYGTVNEKYVLDLVEQCPKGIEFIHCFFDKIHGYIEILLKRKNDN
ncbi:hypothetical protein HHI36_020872 [Cryptolaemus montrouzieri]|uniref:Uncharacterized protein n=1 Tax=Cryptolaemus montrouzieri TaxID=559131 RepID=A0ABD2NBN4_9CUCU